MSAIFAGIMGLSMLFSVLVMPWYNLETKDSYKSLLITVLIEFFVEIIEFQSFKNAEIEPFVAVIKQKLPLIERKEPTEIKEESSYLRDFLRSLHVFVNPNYLAALCVFSSGNFIVHNVLALITQIIGNKNNHNFMLTGPIFRTKQR